MSKLRTIKHNQSFHPKDVFISYHMKTASEFVANSIAPMLESYGISCWYAGRDVKNVFDSEATDAIISCKVFLLILDEGANNSEDVLNEVRIAFNRYKDNRDEISIITFQITECNLSKGMRYNLARFPRIKACPPSPESINSLWFRIQTAIDDHHLVLEHEYYTFPGVQCDYPFSDASYSSERRIVANGKCGENCIWSLDDEGVLFVSGIGRMADLPFLNVSPWWNNHDIITAIHIASGITGIGGASFNECSNVTHVTIPDTVVSIGNNAFRGCRKLEHIDLPSGLITIGSYAFDDCVSLRNINIPGGVGIISAGAFCGCSALSNISLPKDVISVERMAFYNCKKLTSITIPNGVTKIDDHLFSDCSNLKSVIIPESVSEIGEKAFWNCTALSDFVVSKSIQNIGSCAFGGCSGLNLINIDSGNRFFKSEGGILYSNDGKSLICYPSGRKERSFKISPGVKEIGDGAFSGCSQLAQIIIPNSVDCIRSRAFEGCSRLINVIIPDDVTTIEEQAFKDCISLTDLIIPKGVTIIEAGLFYNCPRLRNILFRGTISRIRYGAFMECTGLTNVIIPNGVTVIEDEAYKGCTNVTNIIIPDSVERIGTWAFLYCDKVVSVSVPSSARIAHHAFSKITDIRRR